MKKSPIIKRVFTTMLAAALVLTSASVFKSEAEAADYVTVYRLSHPVSGEYLYTTDTNEVITLSSDYGWINDGAVWNAPTTGTPVYRVFKDGGFHLYTSQANEIDYLINVEGWEYDCFGQPMFYSGGNVGVYRAFNSKDGNHLLTVDAGEYGAVVGAGWNPEDVQFYGVSLPVADPGYVRGVWFSFLDWQEYLKGKNEADFRSAFAKVCDKSIANKINTLYVHVRSHNDAAYPSKIYPWSTEMLEGVPSYDPLKIMTEIARSKGLSFHAWVNPYGYRNGEYAGDPALITKDNIVGGIKEILEGYDVDGIHFDDYFPVLPKEQHNDLIKSVYDTVHSYGKVFGISPQGNIDNNRGYGADIDTWLSVPGYVDYLCPQIYWTDNYGEEGNITMFSDRLRQWMELNKLDLPLYIGLATYRTSVSFSYDPGWTMSDSNLLNQVRAADAIGYDGYVHFKYMDFERDEAQMELLNLNQSLQ